jgi:hypothetical protein
MSTFSVATDEHTLARIDRAANNAGLSRSQYILSWIPETHDGTPKPPRKNARTQTASFADTRDSSPARGR